MSSVTPVVPAARFLEQTLLWNVLIHAAAILSMTLVLPGLPGGPVTADADRIAYIAAHPWLWRLGWLPWHLAAFIDVMTGVALVWTRWIPRLPAVLTLLVTLCAVVPEQTGEVDWSTRGVALAAEAHRTGDLTPYLQLEARSFYLTVVVGASIYLVMFLGWAWCFAAAGVWSRLLTWLTAASFVPLAVGSAGLLLPEGLRPGSAVAAVSNGPGFLLLEAWLVLVAERVLRRARPDEGHGRLAPWRHPGSGPFAWLISLVANSRLVRAFAEWAPTPAFRSDITDVIYVNYLVEARLLEQYVPTGMELQRIGPGCRYALFTFLTYRHGHFGPAFLGPLRRLLPSPVHSNWRTYVRDPRTGRIGIYFVTNAIASVVHALGGRLFSEGMPMHALARGEVTANADGAFVVSCDPGAGSGVQVEASFRPGKPSLPPLYAECWESYHAFLDYAVPQDRAFSSQPWYGRLTRQEIALAIPLESCEPLDGTVVSRTAQGYVGDAAPLCFRVPRVAFRFDREEHDPLPLSDR
jgi:hypothetical protein